MSGHFKDLSCLWNHHQTWKCKGTLARDLQKSGTGATKRGTLELQDLHGLTGVKVTISQLHRLQVAKGLGKSKDLEFSGRFQYWFCVENFQSIRVQEISTWSLRVKVNFSVG